MFADRLGLLKAPAGGDGAAAVDPPPARSRRWGFRFGQGGGPAVAADLIITTAGRWARSAAGRSGEWSAVAFGALVVALRLEVLAAPLAEGGPAR